MRRVRDKRSVTRYLMWYGRASPILRVVWRVIWPLLLRPSASPNDGVSYLGVDVLMRHSIWNYRMWCCADAVIGWLDCFCLFVYCAYINLCHILRKSSQPPTSTVPRSREDFEFFRFWKNRKCRISFVVVGRACNCVFWIDVWDFAPNHVHHVTPHTTYDLDHLCRIVASN